MASEQKINFDQIKRAYDEQITLSISEILIIKLEYSLY